MKAKILAALCISISFLCVMYFLSDSGFSQSVGSNAYDGFPAFYYYQGNQISLNRSSNAIGVRFADGATKEAKQALLNSPMFQPYSTDEDVSAYGITLVNINPVDGPATASEAKNYLEQQPGVEFVTPSFDSPHEKDYLTDQLIVKFKDNISYEDVIKMNHSMGAEIVEKTEWGYYILRVAYPKMNNSLSLANAYAENDKVEYAQPNFIRKIDGPSAAPNDPYFNWQWGLNNYGQWPGAMAHADIDAERAWDITTGSSSVTIAIIDEGVDLTHEDLASKLVGGFDFVDNDTNPQPLSWDGHGTACAGIAAASSNNGLGGAGVDWNARIMPIRVAYHADSNPSTPWTTSDAWLSGGINWASSHGAKVLSNSWGGGTPSDAITSAIRTAKNNGDVVVFAAGNHNTSVSYPASLPEVIAVGASNLCDQRKTPTNDLCNNNEIWWGSNYGPELDVVAPGVHMFTTDITGDGGYSTIANPYPVPNYFAYFNGTSSATPMVAGIASLILAQNPSFTPDQVQYRLESSAVQKGTQGFDPQYGFGRVNAYYALNNHINYLMPWYDEQTAGMLDWVLVANPNTNTTTLNPSITIGQDATSSLMGTYAINPGSNVTPRFTGTQGGPVKVSSSDGSTKALFSQRVLYNNNFNETVSVPESKLETDYFFPWYDNANISTWIIVGNRDSATADVSVYVHGTPEGTYQLAPNQILPLTYSNLMDGPVEVRSTNGQKLLASERVVYNGGFNELMGIPVSKLTTEYSYTWYDDLPQDGFGGDWLLMANPGPNSAHVEVYIQDMATPAATYDIPAGSMITPVYSGRMGGPVKVKSTAGQPIITSQRTLYNGHFEEIAGTPASGLGTSMWFTWYDALNMSSWIMLANTSATASTCDIYLAGVKLNASPINVAAGATVPEYYSGRMNGPVEVRVTSGQNLTVSQRAIYKNSFNELPGTVLSQ